MSREQLFDNVLQYLYENKDDFCNIRLFAERQFDIYDETLVESIADEIYRKDWAKESRDYNLIMRINYNGQQIIDKYGSYSSFLRSEKVAQKKAQRSKTTPNVIKIGITIIFGISAALLGWLNYIDNKTIHKQQNEIELLNKTIDSLKKDIEKNIQTQSDSINHNF